MNTQSLSPNQIREKYLNFFISKYQHSQIQNSSILPENDSSSLFIIAGMQPLVPYLTGEPHPNGNRLVNSQRCIRTNDIDEVGDKTHNTFFEMLGNWSLGDYFKTESIKWSWEFLTLPVDQVGLGLDKKRFCVTVFEGDKDVDKDTESAEIWQEYGFKTVEQAVAGEFMRIYFCGDDNWWKLGTTGPCGPSTEIFYYMGDLNDPKFLNHEYQPNDETDLYVEIWNNVFMSYFRQEDGSLELLENRNVDTGMGFERLLLAYYDVDSIYETELFAPVMNLLSEKSGSHELAADIADKSRKIVADHIRAAVMLMGDKNGMEPSNTDQGYVLRKLIRRAYRHIKKLQINDSVVLDIAENFIQLYQDSYPEVAENRQRIVSNLEQEIQQFAKTLATGEKEFLKMLEQVDASNQLPAALCFKLYDTYGFPFEMTKELAQEHNIQVDKDGFDKAFKQHQELSRAGSEQKFQGGLADHSVETTQLHTATHLLHQALKNIVGDHIEQKGSNITPERLRFDFNHDTAVTKEQLAEVEAMVNHQIQRNLHINHDVMPVVEAREKGAIGLFEDKYGDQIKVYKIGDFSLEICGGPHVAATGELGTFKIKKEQSCGKGIRRIKAVLT